MVEDDSLLARVIEEELNSEGIKSAIVSNDLDVESAVEMENDYAVSRIATVISKSGDVEVTEFGGVIFTRSDRLDINKLEDLRGKRFVAVNKDSFGGWVAAHRELYDAKINPFTDFKKLIFSGGHDEAVFAVLSGEADAGTARTDTLEKLASDGKIDLADIKIINLREGYSDDHKFPFLLSTRLYPEWLLAKIAGTDDVLSRSVARALYSMSANHQVAQAVGISGWSTPRNYNSVADTLRTLRLRPFENYGKMSLEQIILEYRWFLLIITILLLSLLGASLFLLGIWLKRKNDSIFFQSLIEAVPSLIFYKNIKGEYVGGNKAFFDQVMGKDRKEVIGKTALELVPQKFGKIYKSKDEELLANPGRQIYESGIRFADGTDRYCKIYKSTYNDARKRLTGIVGILSDISESKEREKQLLSLNEKASQQQEAALNILEDLQLEKDRAEALVGDLEKFRLAVDGASDHTVITDPDGIILYANDSIRRITGFSIDEMLGKKRVARNCGAA
ncbi:MAG: Tetrathionate sensor histidine kinase TtrS [Parcubacteria group bacterium ADurb.Bin326]|nr:MAG: Tetrathionate sensor histidine kinase TtrS [Parcubacteria group bacterium ADurb.Bin326]